MFIGFGLTLSLLLLLNGDIHTKDNIYLRVEGRPVLVLSPRDFTCLDLHVATHHLPSQAVFNLHPCQQPVQQLANPTEICKCTE